MIADTYVRATSTSFGRAARLAPMICRKEAMHVTINHTHPTPQNCSSSARSPRTPGTVERLVRLGGLCLAYQPIVSLATTECVAFEALTRVRAGRPTAVELFAQAEREHAVPLLDRFAHTLALASAPHLPGETLLFLNAAPVTIAAPDFARRTLQLADRAGLPVSRLVIEITEQEMVTDDHALAANVNTLRDAGIGVAVDDFGAGHSDLARILKLRPSWIKLDRSLVLQLDNNATKRSLVSALVRFAAQNNIQVIAEGIETPAHARTATALGLTLGQGYLYSRPLPLPEAAGIGLGGTLGPSEARTMALAA